MLGLMSLLRPADAVVCSDWAHINVDETGAAERILGAKLIDVPTPDGKLVPDQLADLDRLLGHDAPRPAGVVSITQSTELGTVYSADEVAALCDAAHRLGMRVHMDGARIANATAALGGDVAALRAFTVDAGVDVLTFGGTKNGMLGGEAVVFLAPGSGSSGRSTCASRSPSCRRRCASSRRSSSPCSSDDLWLQLAAARQRDGRARCTGPPTGCPASPTSLPRP